MTTAQDLMTENPMTISPDATVREAARLLYSLDVRHLPVVDEEGALVGMLSDRDLRGLANPVTLAQKDDEDLQVVLGGSVATLMSSDVLSVELEDDAAEIVDLMLEYKVGAVPVVDSEGLLVGIVSYMDVLRN